MATVKLSMQEFHDLAKGIQMAVNTGVSGDSKFTYAISKNRRKLYPFIEELEKDCNALMLPCKEEIEVIAEKYYLKEKGVNKLQNGRPVLNPIFKLEAEKERKEVEEKYKDSIAESKRRFEEEKEIELHFIMHDNFPDMQVGLADLLFPIRTDLGVI